MKKTRKRFTEDFKKTAVKRMEAEGAATVSGDLKVNMTSLYQWKKLYGAKAQGKSSSPSEKKGKPGRKAMTMKALNGHAPKVYKRLAQESMFARAFAVSSAIAEIAMVSQRALDSMKSGQLQTEDLGQFVNALSARLNTIRDNA